MLRGSEADRKLEIFLTSADAVRPKGEHDRSNVPIIGEHKENPDEDRSTKALVQLAGYATKCLEVNRIGDSCLVLRSLSVVAGPKSAQMLRAGSNDHR
jgi:hypothetical protein